MSENSVEQNIWNEEGRSSRRVENIAQWGASWFVLFARYIRVRKPRVTWWAERVACIEVMRNACKSSVGKPEGTRAIWRCRWKDNINMDLKWIVCEYVGWIHLPRDKDQRRALAKTIMDFRVPWKTGNFLTNWVSISFLRHFSVKLVKVYFILFSSLYDLFYYGCKMWSLI
jgi:hypothetical protein